jgi:hypothetical protein
MVHTCDQTEIVTAFTGTNNGILGTEPNSKPIAMTGTAVWSVDEDGKLQRGWIEQASFELYHWLLAK